MSQRQRIEGQVHRSFALQIAKRDAAVPVDGEDSAEQALLATNLILEFPFASEEPYLRSSFWDEPWVEVLGLNADECDLTRLNDGAPILLNHGDGETEDSALRMIGTTTRAWIKDTRAFVEVKLSRRDGMEGLIQDIQDGIVRNISVGYQILERTLIKQAEGMPDEYRVTKWLPMEVSIVDIPADATVGIGRSIEKPLHATRYTVVDLPDEGLTLKGNTMSQAQSAASGGMQQPDIDAIRTAAIAAERSRAADIRTAVRSANLDVAYADELISVGVTIDAARAAVLGKLAERTTAAAVTSQASIQMVGDEAEMRRGHIADALLHRASPLHKLNDGARQFAGLSMLELAKDCLEARGIKTRGMDKMQVATRAFEGGSDLPAILANVANKTLRQAYLSAPRSFLPWARENSAPDFKTITRTALSDTPALETVNENGEFHRGSVSDGKETYQLVTVGKIVGISRQAIINDDLGAFTRIPGLFAYSAANYESDAVYSVLTANANLADGVALFHTTHANLAGTAAVISIASLAAARAGLRKQTTPKGVPMNLIPKYLIVPAALETVANQYVSDAYISTKGADINPFAGKLEVIVEARLDVNSATAWYLAADNAMIDTVEYSYLEGQSGVYIENRIGFDTDGMEIKARLDFAAKALDFRGLFKNAGA